MKKKDIPADHDILFYVYKHKECDRTFGYYSKGGKYTPNIYYQLEIARRDMLYNSRLNGLYATKTSD